ncbi:MAG: SDR family oxidoreductase [Pseudomonadota bacterium]
MRNDRRQFIASSVVGTGLASLGLAGCKKPANDVEAQEQARTDETPSLNILILGGTGFIGPHMVRQALARGHTVTLFNRGKTNADLFPDVQTLIGDRDNGLDALRGKRWDAVIDNSGYVPRHVRDSAELLADSCDQYLFISSISAYADFEGAAIDEDYALGTMPDESVEQVTGETYGPMKALCEKAVQTVFGERSNIVRPGYIVGPGDKTDRWTYWPLRVERGGRMLVPGAPTDNVQFIDARDLAHFVVNALENKTPGVFNAVGPEQALDMQAMLTEMKRVSDADSTFEWVSPEKLEELEATFPIWSSADGEYGGAHTVSNQRAIAKGMTYRALATTIADTLAWWNEQSLERKAAMRSGLRVGSGGGRTPLSMTEQLALEKTLFATLDS